MSISSQADETRGAPRTGANAPYAAADRKPRKRDPEQERLWAEYIHEAAMTLAFKFRHTKQTAKTLRGKRGEADARILRAKLSAYLKDRIPNWFIAEALQLYRGTPTDDAEQHADWMVRNEQLADENDNLFAGLDHLLQVNPRFMMEAMRAEYAADQADASTDKAIITIAREARKLERGERDAKEASRIAEAKRFWDGQRARGAPNVDISLANDCGPIWTAQQLSIPSLQALTFLLDKSKQKSKRSDSRADEETARLRRTLKNEIDTRALTPLMAYGLVASSRLSHHSELAPIWITDFGIKVLEAAAKLPQ